MKLGELKRSLERFPPDMDDCEILVQFVEDNGDVNADCLAFTGHFSKDEETIIILGTWKAADKLRESQPENFPMTWKVRPDINTLNTDNTNEE